MQRGKRAPIRVRWLLLVCGCTAILTAGQIGAQARWQSTQTVQLSAVKTGSFDFGVAWASGSAPSWAAIYPTQSREAVIRITASSTASHLRWRFSVSSNVNASFQGHVTTQAWLGATCGSGPNIYQVNSPSSALAPGAAQDVCVRFTLNSTAPVSLSGVQMSPAIIVTGTQVAP